MTAETVTEVGMLRAAQPPMQADTGLSEAYEQHEMPDNSLSRTGLESSLSVLLWRICLLGGQMQERYASSGVIPKHEWDRLVAEINHYSKVSNLAAKYQQSDNGQDMGHMASTPEMSGEARMTKGIVDNLHQLASFSAELPCSSVEGVDVTCQGSPERRSTSRSEKQHIRLMQTEKSPVRYDEKAEVKDSPFGGLKRMNKRDSFLPIGVPKDDPIILDNEPLSEDEWLKTVEFSVITPLNSGIEVGLKDTGAIVNATTRRVAEKYGATIKLFSEPPEVNAFGQSVVTPVGRCWLPVHFYHLDRWCHMEIFVFENDVMLGINESIILSAKTCLRTFMIRDELTPRRT